MLKQLTDAQEKLAAKQEKLSKAIDEGGGMGNLDIDKVTVFGEGDTEYKKNEITKLSDEVNDLGREVEELQKLSDSVSAQARDLRRPLGTEETEEVEAKEEDVEKGLGDLLVESKAYQSWIKHGRVGHSPEMDLNADATKATFVTGTTGYPVQSLRIGRLTEQPQVPIQVIDTVPGTRTSQNSIPWMLESPTASQSQDNANPRAEAGAYTEARLRFSEQNTPIVSIGTLLPLSDEMLEDQASMRGYVNGRLGAAVMRKLDEQLIKGNGTPPNMTGLDTAVTATVARSGSATHIDVIRRAAGTIRVGGKGVPGYVYLHPNDFTEIQLAKDGNMNYLLGGPVRGDEMRLWGMRMVESDNVTDKTAIVADTGYCMLFVRRGVNVQIQLNADDFAMGKRTIRAGLRAAFVVFRPAAFHKVTALRA